MPVRISVNRRAVDDLLKRDVVPLLKDLAEGTAARADVAVGEDGAHEVLEPEVGSARARVAVITRTHAARHGEATQRTLSTALVAERR